MSKGLAVVSFACPTGPRGGDRARRRRAARRERGRGGAGAARSQLDRGRGVARAARRGGDRQGRDVRASTRWARAGMRSIARDLGEARSTLRVMTRGRPVGASAACHLTGSAPTSKACERSRSASCCSPSGVGFAAGGYVGVDVFFVISGFLITQVLVSELDRRGRVSLARFYARRVKRLMPQVLTVIAVVAAARRCCSRRCARRPSRPTSMAAGAYVMNWRLSADAVDYFAAARRPAARPLLVAGRRGAVLPRVAAADGRLTLRLRSRGNVHRALPSRCAPSPSRRSAMRSRASRVAPDQAYYSAFGAGLGARARGAAGGRARATGGRAGCAATAAGVGWPRSAWPRSPSATGRRSRVRRRCCRRSAPPRCSPPAPPRRSRGAAAGAHAAAAALRRPGVLRLVRLALAGARLRGRRVGAAVDRRGHRGRRGIVRAAVATYRWIEEPLRRSKLHIRRTRVTLAAAVAGPALAVGVGVALSASISSRRRWRRARRSAPPAATDAGIQRVGDGLRPPPSNAGADPAGRSMTVASSTSARRSRRVRLRRPGVEDDGRAVGDSHAMQYFPALRADRAAPPLAARGHHQGRLPAAARAGDVPISRASTPRATSGARTRCGGSSRWSDPRSWSWARPCATRSWSGGRRLERRASARALAARVPADAAAPARARPPT